MYYILLLLLGLEKDTIPIFKKVELGSNTYGLISVSCVKGILGSGEGQWGERFGQNSCPWRSYGLVIKISICKFKRALMKQLRSDY